MQCLEGKPLGLIFLHKNGNEIIDKVGDFLKNHIYSRKIIRKKSKI